MNNPQDVPKLKLDAKKWGLLFDVRRSVRYHDRRRAFFEQLHRITSLLTIVMAGSFLFDLGKDGDAADWLKYLSAFAAACAAIDMVIGFSKRSNLHADLREKFAMLEIDMVTEDNSDQHLQGYLKRRLLIEKDEPPIYRVLDGLCRNELLIAEGYNRKDHRSYFFRCNRFQRFTSQLFRWDNVFSA
ncbi:hypothetical protein [Methylomonas koyamae]|uniref:hypothetical protein n=1 Tax=Methylomonas koyamae TaxID=702114 RepID=UPI00112709B5|nr:hypothetical protein [Methylomonas koyamae]TPQ28967.1 hypothetical protein C2U68_03135 [Methylomonas koyamae]